MLKHGILKNGWLNNDSVISIILNISEESVNNKMCIRDRIERYLGYNNASEITPA